MNLVDLIGKFSFQTVEDCSNIDPASLVAASLIVEKNAIYPEIYDEVKKSGIESLSDLRDLYNLHQILKVSKDNDNEFKFTLKNISKLLPGIDFDNAKKLYRKYEDQLIFACVGMISLKNLKHNVEGLKMFSQPAVEFGYVSQKKQNKFIKEDLTYNSNFTEFEANLRKIVNKLYDKQREYDSSIRLYNKIRFNYLECIKLLSNNDQDINLAKFEKICKLLHDDDIKTLYIDIINSKLAIEIPKEQKINSKLKGDDILLTKDIFMQFNIDFEEFSQSFKENFSIDNEDLKSMLGVIKGINIDNISMIEEILSNSTTSILSKYYSYIQDGILSRDYFISNINTCREETFKLLEYNISIIDEYNLNLLLFYDYNYILFSNSDILKNNLELLENYDLLKNIKNGNNLKFLMNNNISEILTILYEVDLDSLLSVSMNILNYDLDHFKRLILLKRIGELPNNMEDLVEVLDTPSKKYFVLDSDIDLYARNFYEIFIPEEVLSILNTRQEISEKFYKISIGNIECSNYNYLVNYNKIKDENLSEEDKRFYSMIYKSYFSIDEIKEIENIIKKEQNVLS